MDEARQRLTPELDAVRAQVAHLKAAERISEVVVEIKLSPRYLAKSYYPEELLDKTSLTLRGSGVWHPKSPIKDAPKDEPATEFPYGRRLYVSGRDDSIEQLAAILSGRVGGKTVQAQMARVEHLSLPGLDDRLRLHVAKTAAGSLSPVEIVLFDWRANLRPAAKKRLLEALQSAGVDPSNWIVKDYDSGPVFVAARVPKSKVADIASLNFVRLTRSLSRVGVTRNVAGPKGKVTPTTHAGEPTTRIAVFDAGVASAHGILDKYVTAIDATSKPSHPDLVAHGTAVCSAAVFGPLVPGGPLPAPRCRVTAYRVLPDERNDDLELYGVIETIEAEVPKLHKQGIRVVNLSIGPIGPIDDAPSRFTYAIDRLSHEYDILFLTAVGNDGQKKGLERVQAPSDSVNNLGIGAYCIDPVNGGRGPAPYSCQGPGREGGLVKPDLLQLGGSQGVPYQVLDVVSPDVVGTWGTSFATPTAASIAGQVLDRSETDLRAQACRALMIHAALRTDDDPLTMWGWGLLPLDVDEVLSGDERRVSVLYDGDVQPRRAWRLPFLLPDAFHGGGKVEFSWTVVCAPDVVHHSPDEYTPAYLLPAFRPHSRVHRLTRRVGTKNEQKTKHLDNDGAEIELLRSQGWRLSAQPVSDQNTVDFEHGLRAESAKWDTVMRGRSSKIPSSVHEPALTVEMFGRGAWDTEDETISARFAAVLTVTAPKFKGNLHDEVLARWSKLRPLRLRPAIQVRAKIGK